jgi:hypothetical protein
MVKVGLGYPVDWVHAASAATRLISASNLIFHSRQKIVTSAYHFEITSEVLEMGMKNSFSNTLLQSVNVMANVTIHSVPLDKMLHRNTKKKVMQWHSQPDTTLHTHRHKHIRSCLLHLIKMKNPQHKSYGLDYIAKDVDTVA